MPTVSRLAAAAALVAIAALDVYLKAEVIAGLDPALAASCSDERGRPYFYTQDSFYYFRQSAEVLDHGHPGTRLVDGVPWDDLSFAPAGRPARGGFLAYLQAWTARLVGVVRGGGGREDSAGAGADRSYPSDLSDLVWAATYLPAMVTALLVLLSFALGRRLGGTACGLVAALFAATHPAVASHGHAGIADTDSLALALLTAVLWAAVGLADALAARSRTATAGWAVALVGVLALFRWTWTGWIAAAALAAAWLGARGLAAAFLGGRRAAGGDAPDGSRPRPAGDDRPARGAGDRVGGDARARPARDDRAAPRRETGRAHRYRRPAAILVAAAAAVALLAVAGAPVWRRALVYLGLGSPSFFPRGTGRVVELLAPTPGALLDEVGGPLFALLAAAGLVLAGISALPALRARRDDRSGPAAAVRDRLWLAALLAAWLAATLAMGAAAQRFLFFAAPPLVLFAALAVVELAGRLPDRRLRAGAAALAALAAAASFAPHLADLSRRRPAIDRSVAHAAAAVRERAAPDALINVWWDHGYAWAALAGRGVTIDGGSYQTSRLYWFSRVLTALDEEFAVAALRLIDCGGEAKLFDLLRPTTGRDGAVALIDELLHRHQTTARLKSLLAAGVPARFGRPTLDLLACRPPEAWLVVSSDLVGKTTSWVDLAHWNFAESTAPAPRPAITAEVPCRLEGGLLACEGHPATTLEAGGFVQAGPPGRLAARGRPNPEGLVPILYDPGDGPRLVYAGPAVARSLFAELYYFRGAGLRRFTLEGEFYEPSSGERVLVFRVGW